MGKKLLLQEAVGEMQAGAEFLREYRKAVLLTLQEKGILTRELLQRCLEKLETDEYCG